MIDMLKKNLYGAIEDAVATCIESHEKESGGCSDCICAVLTTWMPAPEGAGGSTAEAGARAPEKAPDESVSHGLGRVSSCDLTIDKCPHGNLAVSLMRAGEGMRLSPVKCCGRWDEIMSWRMTARQLRGMANEILRQANHLDRESTRLT